MKNHIPQKYINGSVLAQEFIFETQASNIIYKAEKVSDFVFNVTWELEGESLEQNYGINDMKHNILDGYWFVTDIIKE